MRDSFSKEYLESVSTDPRAEGATMRALWQRRWGEDYAKLFAFPCVVKGEGRSCQRGRWPVAQRGVWAKQALRRVAPACYFVAWSHGGLQYAHVRVSHLL